MIIHITDETNEHGKPVEFWAISVDNREVLDGIDAHEDRACDHCGDPLDSLPVIWIVPEIAPVDKTDLFVHPKCFHDCLDKYTKSVHELHQSRD